MEKQTNARVVVDPTQQTIKDLTKQVYDGYKRIKELSEENDALKKQLLYLRNNSVPLR